MNGQGLCCGCELKCVCSLPGIDVVCDSGEPAPEGCRRPHSRRVAPECACFCWGDEHCVLLCGRRKEVRRLPETKVGSCWGEIQGLAVASRRWDWRSFCVLQ
jgi:hypothetical protein